MIDFSCFSHHFDQQKVDLDATEARWDRRAEEVSQFTVKEDDMALLTVDRHLDLGKARVLDISFGAGRYLEEFLRRGAAISGVEISGNMCHHARQRLEQTGLPWDPDQLVHASWEGIDLAERNWHQAFDLVFVNMSPALSSTAMLKKALDATRQGLYVASHGHREDALLAALQDALGLERRNPGQRYAHDLYLTFNILYGWGYFPQLQFEARVKMHAYDPEYVLERYASWLWRDQTPRASDRQQLLQLLQDRTDSHGNVPCTSRDIVGHLWLDKSLRSGT